MEKEMKELLERKYFQVDKALIQEVYKNLGVVSERKNNIPQTTKIPR